MGAVIKGINGVLKAGRNFVKAVGTMEKAGQKAGEFTVKAGKKLASMADNFEKQSKPLADFWLTPDENRQLGFKLSKKGWAAFGAVGAVSSLGGAYNTYNADRAGTPTGITTPTPQMPPLDKYTAKRAEEFGAGGDLVFALNANRRG